MRLRDLRVPLLCVAALEFNCQKFDPDDPASVLAFCGKPSDPTPTFDSSCREDTDCSLQTFYGGSLAVGPRGVAAAQTWISRCRSTHIPLLIPKPAAWPMAICHAERCTAQLFPPETSRVDACLQRQHARDPHDETAFTMELLGKPLAYGVVVTGIAFEPATVASTQLGRCISRQFENLAVAPWRGRLVISLQVGKPANYEHQVRQGTVEPTEVESGIYMSSATAAVRPHRVHPFERTFIRTPSGATIGAPVGESGTVLVKLVLPRAKSAPAAAEGLLSKGDFDGALQALEPCLGKPHQEEACQVLEIVALRFRDGPGDLEKALQAHEVLLSRQSRSLPGLDQLLQIELR